MNIKDFMEAVDYRITEGSEYQWRCYGHNAYSLDCWDGDDRGYSIGIVFDTKTQVVYQMEAWDYGANREYRWINPDYSDSFAEECLRRGHNSAESIDDRKFVDLETEEDMLAKAHAIAHGVDYDDRVSVPIDLPEADLYVLMKQAHELDITLNQHVENLLRHHLELLNGSV